MFQRPLTLMLLQKYRDTNGRSIVLQIGGVYTTFCQEEGILLQEYRDRHGRCIAILFESIGVRVDLTLLSLDGPNRQSPIASVQRRRSTLADHSTGPRSFHTNERHLGDSNHSATSARSKRTKFCVFRGRYDRQRTLVIRIAATTLASDSALTLARFRPSKLRRQAAIITANVIVAYSYAKNMACHRCVRIGNYSPSPLRS